MKFKTCTFLVIPEETSRASIDGYKVAYKDACTLSLSNIK